MDNIEDDIYPVRFTQYYYIVGRPIKARQYTQLLPDISSKLIDMWPIVTDTYIANDALTHGI